MNIFLILTCLGTCVFAKDYCQSSHCPQGTHVACNNNGELGKACGIGAKKMMFTPSDMQDIVKMHNEKRNLIAGGGLEGYDKAKTMATMSWNEKLAEHAALNANTCIMNHDCHGDDPYSGQNIFWGTTYKVDILQPVEAWFDEYKLGNMSVIKEPATYYKETGHFTAMVKNTNDEVGCGAVTFPIDNPDPRFTAVNFLMTCNYRETNMMREQAYIGSSIAASGCRATNPEFHNLCELGDKSWY